MSAEATGPQLYPSTNCVHSTNELPLGASVIGSASVNTDASTRNPYDPVSTCTLSMVWHWVVLPGTQMVTVVYRVFTVGLVAVGPPLTTTGTTLEAAATVPVVEVELLPGGLPPPHDVPINTRISATPLRNTRVMRFINVSHPVKRRQAGDWGR